MILTVTVIVFLGELSAANCIDPLGEPFSLLKTELDRGCDVNQLPDSIVWCNDSLNKNNRLPVNTWCQSQDQDVPHLVCRGGEWIRRYDADYREGRYKRDIRPAVANITDQSCQFLCTDDLTGIVTHSRPWFSVCPVSVTLHPEGDNPNVTHSWHDPVANDTDGYITSVEHIVGPVSPAVFTSELSPGRHHVISYMATDNDNLRWPCDFTVIAEVPDCPPIIHIDNGNTTCTMEHARDSNCSISCLHGYTVNGTAWGVCQDNGTWSYGEDVPQCLPAVCEPDLSSMNYTDLELVCESNTTEYDTVCWLRCLYNNTLRNDAELSRIVAVLLTNINDTMNASAIARQKADDARDLADYLETVAEDAKNDYVQAYNDTENVRDQFDNAVNELDGLQTQLNEKQAELAVAEENYQNATLNNDPDASFLAEVVDNITTTIDAIISDLNDTAVNVASINESLVNAELAAELAKNASVEAENNYTQAVNHAAESEAAADAAAEDVTQAVAAYMTAQEYSGLADVEVPTFARCQADGTWAIEGDPYCIDIHTPKISCVPLLTVYVEAGQTEGVATWDTPTVYDNSPNVTVVLLSGPKPGDSLTLGQHVASYMATDPAGTNVYCDTYINIEARSCGILDNFYDNENLTYSCDSFDQGATCTFSCNNYQAVTDPGTATCELDSSLTPVDVSWNLHDVTCEDESCPIPPSPEHGTLECFQVSNSTDNTTNSTTSGTTAGDCVLICNSGYMPPYRVVSSYLCNLDGTWSPEEFPTECIPSGNAQYAIYDLILSAIPVDVCSNLDTADIVSQVQAILEEEMASYVACNGGYNCNLTVKHRACMDGDDDSTLELNVTVLVTCDGLPVGDPSEATCDLEHDLMSSLHGSFTQSIGNNDVLSSTQLTNIVIMADTTDLPKCATGVLVGHYCAQCPKGTFYANETVPKVCMKCDTNSYQNSYHSNACTTCEFGSRTGISGATSKDDCEAYCSRGTYSETTTKPCVACSLGTYQNLYGQSSCKSCPSGTWTTIAGALSETDCVEFDIYFTTDQADFALTNATDQMTVVFWMKNDQSPSVSIGVFYDLTDFAFVFEATGTNSQLLFKSVENTPTGIAIESYEWTMVGIVWNCPVVTVYKNGEVAFNFNIQDPCGQSSLLVMSANTGTLLSGLGVTKTLSDDAEMMRLYEDCSNRLASSVFSMDNLAALRKHAIKFVPTNCSGTNETTIADNICAVHLCENDSSCVENNDTGYSCNCTEDYGGPFCEELLVHGNWSDWFNGSSCSRTCGTGEQLLYRYCNNPTKSYYGNDCEGNNTDVVECFLEECIECSPLDSESGATCDLEDDRCSPECPRGYVLPKGQQDQVFKCGAVTKSEWVPLHRLPECAVSLQPESYSMTMTFTFVDPVPCSEVSEVTSQFTSVASTLRCVQNSTCTAGVAIKDCGTGPSHLELTLVSALTSTSPFDLPGFYNTSQLIESIREAVMAIYMLELTVQDLLDNPSFLSVTLGNTTFTVRNDMASIMVQARTHCGTGQVPTQGVCAQCQKGTYMQGEACLYCPRGSYTDRAAQTSCTPCADRYSTLYIGARDSSECFEVEPPPTVINVLVIVLGVIFGLLGIFVVCLIIRLGRRFYRGKKEREKFDMEADRNSLYTDFQDIAYNVYFKRRMVLGFDEDGLPIISKFPVQNGFISHGEDEEKMSLGDKDMVSLGDDYPGQIPKPGKGNEPFAYPTDYDGPPFDYNPYILWPEDSVPPPVIPEPDFDFPAIHHALRFRMPGRSHLQQVYPLQMFGYTEEKIRGRTRKLLPLPVAIPIPKKLPKLMHRSRKKDTSLVEQLKARFGIGPSQDRDETTVPLLGDRGTGRYVQPSVPALSYTTKDLKPPHREPKGRPGLARPKSKASVDSWTVRPHKTLTQRVKSARRKLRSTLQTKKASPMSPRSPRPDSEVSPRMAKSAIGLTPPPRSISGFTSRLARSAGMGPRLIDHDRDHPKPSRFVVPKTPPALPKFPSRSMLKSADPSPREPRPATSFTGRKSVTIKEGDMITRPTTAVTELTRGRSTDIRSTRDIHLTPYHNRPWSSMYSSAGTEDANIFDLDWVSSEYGGTSRPSTSMSRPFTAMTRSTRSTATPHRPKTPLIHPAPHIHGNVKVVTRTPDFNMLVPKKKFQFGAPPVDHKTSFTNLPSVFKSRVTPQNQERTTPGPRRVWQEEDDILDLDYDDDESLESGTFFLTEVPDVRKNSGKGHKTSPPPPYSEVNQLTENTSSPEEF